MTRRFVTESRTVRTNLMNTSARANKAATNAGNNETFGIKEVNVCVLKISSNRSSGECIPANFVCDGQSDCAGAGEDESACEEFGSQPTPAQRYLYSL